MKSFKNIFWFTFVELVISMFISSIILTGVFFFISENTDEIISSTNKTNFYNNLYDFIDKVNSLSEKYSSWIVIVDSESWTWSDIFLFQNELATDGLLLWVVNNNTKRFEKTVSDYNIYYDKIIWYRKISWWEIASIVSNTGWIYDMSIFDDSVFEFLKVKDIQFNSYNSWIIVDANITFIPNYSTFFVWKDWKEVNSESFLKLNLNF